MPILTKPFIISKNFISVIIFMIEIGKNTKKSNSSSELYCAELNLI